MKPLYTILLAAFFLIGCNSDDSGNNGDNPFLSDPLVDINLNLNLPEYNPLKFPGEYVIISGQGIRGVLVYNLNNTTYLAFDLTDPNHRPNSCSRMTLDGIVASCPCTEDSNSYNIALFGQHETDENAYTMQQYRAERSGDNIFVSN